MKTSLYKPLSSDKTYIKPSSSAGGVTRARARITLAMTDEKQEQMVTTKTAPTPCGQCEECREGFLCSEMIRCYYCAAAPEFTLDFVDDGIDVCSTHLAAAIYELGGSGHEWGQTFEGQYPKYIKVTPHYEDLPA